MHPCRFSPPSLPPSPTLPTSSSSPPVEAATPCCVLLTCRGGSLQHSYASAPALTACILLLHMHALPVRGRAVRPLRLVARTPAWNGMGLEPLLCTCTIGLAGICFSKALHPCRGAAIFPHAASQACIHPSLHAMRRQVSAECRER